MFAIMHLPPPRMILFISPYAHIVCRRPSLQQLLVLTGGVESIASARITQENTRTNVTDRTHGRIYLNFNCFVFARHTVSNGPQFCATIEL